MTTHAVRALLASLLFAAIAPAGLAQVGLAQAPPRPSVPAVPAPVPPAVAIPRPTEAEIATARTGLAKFLLGTDAATRAVLLKYPNLVEVRPPGPNSAIVPALAPPFQAKHQANLQVAASGEPNLLFMGDSITDFWRNPEGPYAGKAVLDTYFGHWKVANFGIAGDTTQGVLYRLLDGEGKGFSPRAVMLMIGTNNTARNSAAEIAEGIGAIVLALQRDFPNAKILLLGVFPRGRAADPVRAQIVEINRTIAKLHDGDRVHYLDIGDRLVDANGDVPAEIMSDGLHPTPKGYEIWAQAVIEPLTLLMSGATASAN